MKDLILILMFVLKLNKEIFFMNRIFILNDKDLFVFIFFTIKFNLEWIHIHKLVLT